MISKEILHLVLLSIPLHDHHEVERSHQILIKRQERLLHKRKDAKGQLLVKAKLKRLL